MTTTQNSSDLVTIGLDLGDRAHHYCVLDFAGTIQTEAAIPNTRECLAQLSGRFPRATFIMETGTHSPWISRWLEALGHRVIVANARKLRAISQSHTKTDTEDAHLLARLGRADPALPSPVKHRSDIHHWRLCLSEESHHGLCAAHNASGFRMERPTLFTCPRWLRVA